MPEPGCRQSRDPRPGGGPAADPQGARTGPAPAPLSGTAGGPCSKGPPGLILEKLGSGLGSNQTRSAPATGTAPRSARRRRRPVGAHRPVTEPEPGPRSQEDQQEAPKWQTRGPQTRVGVPGGVGAGLRRSHRCGLGSTPAQGTPQKRRKKSGRRTADTKRSDHSSGAGRGGRWGERGRTGGT